MFTQMEAIFSLAAVLYWNHVLIIFRGLEWVMDFWRRFEIGYKLQWLGRPPPPKMSGSTPCPSATYYHYATVSAMMEFCCTLSAMLLSLVLWPSHIWSCRVLLFFLLVPGFLLNVEEKYFRICNIMLKSRKYWINDISGNIEAVLLKLSTTNVHHKRNKMTPLVLLPWQ